MATWKKVITEAHDSNYKNSNVTVSDLGGGSGTTTFLRKDGSWATPTDTNTQLSTEQVQDIVGAMFSGNTETRINATYQDSDGTIDLVVNDMTANTQLSNEQVQDIVGAMFSGNTETNITATYQDSDGTIDLVVTGAPTGDSGNAAVYDNSGTPTLKTGITAAEMRTAIGAQASGSYAAVNGSSSANFTTNDLSVTGDLTVIGTIDTVSQTNTKILDKTITLSEGANSEGNADGSGILLDTNVTNKAPALRWYNDSTSPNQPGCIGNGWTMSATNETSTKYHIMGFKTGTAAPVSGDQSSTSTKAEGEGSFYWDSTNNNLYVCTNSDSSNTSGS